MAHLALDAFEQGGGLLLHPLTIEHGQRLARLGRQEPRPSQLMSVSGKSKAVIIGTGSDRLT